MKIAFFEMDGRLRTKIKSKLKDYDVVFFKERINDVDLNKIKDVEIISVFIYSVVSLEILNKLKKIKLIATRSTGYDHIDSEYCLSKNISVCNVPFYGENTVAEHAFAMILDLSRNISKAYKKVLGGDFSLDGVLGFDLKGKTIGVVGSGNIGLHVIRIAKGFDMKVLAYDLYQNRVAKELLNFEYVELDELLAKSDIVTLHAPYNKATHHMINEKSISKMKKNAILINTARGGLVDTDALFNALNDKKIMGAGLDVIEREELLVKEHDLIYQNKCDSECSKKLIKNHAIIKMDNVLFTPHIGFYSKEAIDRIFDTTIQNIDDFCLGKKNKNFL
jgi:D-lactate dehydrogenase